MSPVSSADAQALATDHSAVLSAIGSGDPNGGAAAALDAYATKAISVALSTNNPSAVQSDLNSANALLASDTNQVAVAHPVQDVIVPVIGGGSTAPVGGTTAPASGGGTVPIVASVTPVVTPTRLKATLTQSWLPEVLSLPRSMRRSSAVLPSKRG